jgi:putative transposase
MLLPEKFYHIFNRGNNRETIFPQERNYFFFLERYKKYCASIFKTFAYALMPNHFHLVVQVKAQKEIESLIRNTSRGGFKKYRETELSEAICESYVTKELNHFFVSYSKAVIVQENRTGSLLQNRFHHPGITSDEQLRNTIIYAHLNATHHGFAGHIDDWRFTSYHDCIAHDNSLVAVSEVLELFDGIDNFIFLHRERNKDLLLMNFDED